MKPALNTCVPLVFYLFFILIPGLAPGLVPGFVFGADARAAESAEELDPMVVTARGRAAALSQTPGGVGVVTAEQINRSRPVSLTDITRMIPGVEKTSDSPWGSDINIRGLSRNSVLFLIDGCRVNTATDINARFGLVNPDDIERIEVLKGPISSLYGWGAMGGVVNVITRKAHYSASPRTSAEARGEAWSNPSGYGAYGMGTYEGPNTWFTGSAGYRDYSDRKSARGTVVHNSQFRDLFGRFSSGYKWNRANETLVNIQVMEGQNIGIPGKGLALSNGPDATYPSTRRVLASLSHILTPENTVVNQSRVNLFLQEVDRNVRLDAFPGAAVLEWAEPGADHATMGGSWTSHLSLGSHEPVVGVELWQWRIDNTERVKRFRNGRVGIDSSLGNVSQMVGGVFAEDTWALGPGLDLNLGGRLDLTRVKSDDLYSWISPPSPGVPVTRVREAGREKDASFQGQAGLTWQLFPGWSATALAAASYRPPDLMDRFKYVNLGSGVSLHGNPELNPEQSLFFETGLHYLSGSLRISGSLFCNRLRDMITEFRVSPTRIEMRNLDRARIFGSELSGEWQMGRGIRTLASLAWARGDNRTTGEALPFIAPLNTRVSLIWEPLLLKGWQWEITHEWAAAQDRVPSGGTPSQSFQTLDLRAGYTFQTQTLSHEILLGVTNLFDEDYDNFLATSRGMVLKEAGTSLFAHYKIEFLTPE